MSDHDAADRETQRLAAEALADGTPTAWFERLYDEAERGVTSVPWDLGAPNPMIVEQLTGRDGRGSTAMVVGCGYGRDAEYVASLGFDTTAFDVSPTAIEQAQRRHPGTPVHYEVADLLALPAAWHGAFDLVVECRNVQSLPPTLHADAAAAVSSMVAPGGALLVLAAVDDGSPGGPPWPLTRAEIDAFAVDGLRAVSVEQQADPAGAPVRWQAEFSRPAIR